MRIISRFGQHAALLLGSLMLIIVAGCGATSAANVVPTTATVTIAPTMTATPTISTAEYQRILRGLTPVRMTNAKIHLDAPILGVQVNTRGEMNVFDDAPAGDPKWDSAFWYAPGSYPGQNGNAVIAAHVNRPTPGPGPFGSLTNLIVGDTIQVQTANGTMLTFSVTDTSVAQPGTIGATDPTLDRVFGPASTPNLNLVTCTDFNGKMYTKRFIVFTQLVGASPFPAAPTP